MLHAEQSCTQHIFRYLLPLDWLPDSNSIMSWYRSGRPRPTPPILKAMKDVLRQIRKSARFLKESHSGALAHKERCCFHNYADPKLAGAISPHKEVVQRSVDRA